MKKLLIVLVALFSFTLLGCDNENEIEVLENRVAELESRVDEIETLLTEMEFIEGINGQREYYTPTALSIQLLGEELDKTKAPSYVLDNEENYINFSQVAQLLVTKYFGTSVTITTAEIGYQVKLMLQNHEITQEEYLTRMILLIDELSNYDFYIIGSSEIYIQANFDGTSYIKIPIQTLRSSFVTITPEVIYSRLYEVKIYRMTFDIETVQSLYNDFVANETFVGYVLNYE